MSRTRTNAPRVALVLLLGVVAPGVVACGPSAEVERQLAELTAVSAEKDSLLVLAADNAKLMSDISAEVARVKAPAAEAGSAEGVSVTRESVLADIQQLTARIVETEDRLLKSQERVDALSKDNTRLQAAAKDFQRATANFQATIANQKETITALTQELTTLRDVNVRLSTENVTLVQERTVLADTVNAMTIRDNTVYFAIGTKDELRARGVIEEEGGSRVLFVFGKRGTTIVPARVLDPAQFTAVDKRQMLEIPLPLPDRAYRIATRQDLSALETPPDEEGRFKGTLRIADPDRFWATSKYLILVQS
ncbi:MAG: hypothetical protein ACREMQ_14650 [Longimicrobiales bacterium]